MKIKNEMKTALRVCLYESVHEYVCLCVCRTSNTKRRNDGRGISSSSSSRILLTYLLRN